MSEILFVELDAAEPDAVASSPAEPDADATSAPTATWTLVDDSAGPIDAGTFAVGPDQIPGGAERNSDFTGEVVVLVPTRDVLRTLAEVPSRQHRQIVQAVPYVVEEQLAKDVEQCFFALGGRTPSGMIEVAVTDESNMQRWCQQLAEMQLTSALLLPRSELLPWTGGVEALVEGDSTLVRWGEGLTLQIDTSQFAMTIALLDAQQKPHINIHVSEDELASIELQLRELEASEESPPQVHTFAGSARNWLYHNYIHAKNLDPVNLFQGEYKVETKEPGGNVVWRSVAVLAACTLGTHLLSLLGQGVYLSIQAGEYQSAYQALYQEVFPADGNVRDYRRRWNARLGSASEGNEFLSLFAQSSAGLNDAGLTLRNVNFNESRGDLVLQVVASRSEALVEYAEMLAQQGLIAEIGTISQEGGSVKGSIRVKTGGAS